MQAEFVLTGEMPLLFHADDVEAGDRLKEWRQDPENKNQSQAGDDRSPAWTWQTYLYHDGVHLAWPFANLAKGLTTAATRVQIPGGKNGKTFKELAAGALSIDQIHLEFRTKAGHQIPMEKISSFRDRPFSQHVEAARKLGFDLLVKRCKIGQSKHVRVRAQFQPGWTIRGSITVQTSDITFEHLRTFFTIAGKGGQGDWRPWSPKSPGPYGQFVAELKQAKTVRVA